MLSEELPASLHVRPLADSIGSESQNPSIIRIWHRINFHCQNAGSMGESNRTETLRALGNLAGKASQSTCCWRSGFSNKYNFYAP
ncbi:hypothetical protein [Microcoleus sp. OTE_8_concoct_300]|uniref:hypothetical protein n=1 Tax=Microcoleus sp. OTE_8_concoct_300 TaxID=2964710 RepID=UPI00403FC1D5